MSIQAKRPRTRPPTVNQPARSTDSPPAASPWTGAQTALDDCITATSLIEVTLRSLDAQVIACPEQETLKKALQAVWSVHGWIDGFASHLSEG